MASLIQKYYEDYASPLLGQLALNDQFLSTPLAFAVTAFTVTALIPTSYLRIKHTLEELSKQTNDPTIRKKRSLLHEKFHESKLPEKIDYIIIGSGMGGLSSAAILARLGYKVVVLEQHHDVVGGGTHMFDLKGYSFDSGLHYTVPWSIPLLALTCLKKPKDCIPFDLMTEDDGTIDRLYLTPHNSTKKNEKNDFLNPLRMKYHESHLKDLYKQYPNDHKDINNFILLSNRSMNFVKIFLFSRLLPKCLQSIYWKLIPSSIMETAQSTAEELLPKYIKNKQLISIFSSMWIDTGCRPDNASFMLTASVFRGISLEGGCYPRGGSTELAKELVTTIESNGGKVFIRANVEKILFNDTIQRVDRVQLKNGQIIHALKGIISATGYHNTMNNLIDAEVADRYGVVRSLPIKQSAGFVMANIGINASPEYIGATKSNTWHIPTNENGDIFPLMEEYFKNPLKPNSPIPAFITFPSVKDISYNEQEKNKTSCQMLLMAEYDWFKQYLPNIVQEKLNNNEYHTYDHNDRDKENYEKLKEIWKERILEIFLHYFPKAKDHLAVVDISTPLSIEYYLRATHGAAVGIDCTPARFCDPLVRENLDPISKIPGLALTGQDTAICGVTLCQLAGVITALRLEGFHAALKILLQSILLGNK